MALADKATAEAALESHGTLKLEEDATMPRWMVRDQSCEEKSWNNWHQAFLYKVPGFR